MLCSHFWVIAISIQTISLILAPEFPSLGNRGRIVGEERERERQRLANDLEEVRQRYNQPLTQVMKTLLLGRLGTRKEERDFPESFLIFYLDFTLFLGPLGSLPGAPSPGLTEFPR